MPPLYVVQQGAKIRIQQGRLSLERDGETLLQVPLGHVSQVVVFGNVGLTTPAIGALLGKNIEVAFLSEDGQYRGRLSSGLTPHVPVRRAQYRALENSEFVLALARHFVAAKLQHQRVLLQRHNRDRNDPDIHAAIDQLQRQLHDLPRKTALSSLRGLEGSATAAYFSAFRRLFGAEWRFEKRTRRPPADPVNVLLSLGYTLLTHVAVGAVQAAGLDPYAGFLHDVVYNRPALGLDLVEEFRPVVDGLALWACNSGQLTPEDFTPGPAERPVILSEAGKKRYLLAFEERLERRFTHPLRGLRYPLRLCIFEQARQIQAAVLEQRPVYKSMGFR
jgi:CRISPR-associated protein Cas1